MITSITQYTTPYIQKDLASTSYVGVSACPANGPRFCNNNSLISLPKFKVFILLNFISNNGHSDSARSGNPYSALGVAIKGSPADK
jgi:hypothetical protein